MSYLEDLGRQSRHVLQLGAFTQTKLFDYRSAAEPIAAAAFAKTPSATHLVITMEVDGKSPIVMPFSDKNLASEAFDEVIQTPGRRAFTAYYDRTGVIGEQHFAAQSHTETRFTFGQWKSAAPWLVVGAALIAGAVFLTTKKSPTKAKPRRARASWRRRITTTWR
jgi:hypothetical protein